MTKISIYQIDEYVTADDKWIGTDVNTYNKTKNFTPRKLSNYFNGSQVINTGVDLLYKYFTITPPETRPTGTLSFETEIGPTVNFSAISTFLLSNTTLKGNYIVEFFDFLVGTNVLLYKAKNINLFGSYKIVSVEEYLEDPNFFVVNVEFIEGNGFIEEDEDYMISLIDISSGSQDLQEVTDIGSSTTNSITANSFIKIGGTGTNILLDDGNTVALSSIGGNTNLSTSQTSTNFTINSDTGDDAIVPLGDGDLAGATLNNYTTAEKNKLAAITGTNTGDQDLQSVTTLGATTTKGITITVGDGGGDGIHSFSSQGYGIRGESSETIGVYGTANTTGVYGQGNVGVHAYSAEGTGIEVYGNGSISISVNLGNSNKGLVINSGASSTGNPIEIVKSDDIKFTINQQGEQSIVKIPGGLSTEYLMADGTTTTGGTGGGSIPHATASGTDTYTATVSGVTSYADGDAYLIRFTNGNTTVATLNINALGAISLYRNNDGPLIGGDVQSNGEMLCVYNSTANTFQCIGTSPNSIISYVTNAETVTITKGQVVYAFGGTGDRMTVKLASNIGDSTSAQTVGIVLSASIAANQKGFIIFQGLIDNLNILPTSTWADGDQVYLGVTAGSITKVKPYAPNHLVYVGIVTTASNGNSGRMYVRVQNGYELDELHNVQAQTPTLKDTLYYDNTVSPAQWKTASLSTILGYTPANDLNVVHLSGTEIITGAKTFTDNLTAGRYLYSGGSIFPEFGQTFYINGTGATHYFGGGTSNAQNNLEVSNGNLKIGLQTASTIASFDANKNVVSLTTANGYPTLTELKSLVGISTTAIQTQLNSKQASSSILSGLSALSFSGGTPFVRMISGSVFTLDTTIYLTSVGVSDLTATGTPSATTYLRGDNTWSSIPVPSQNSYTMLANNTASSAVPTEQPFENLTNQTYSGTIVWGPGTAPSTNPQHTYSLSQVGNLVTLIINLSYGVAGASTLTSVACELPSTAPTPALPTSVVAANEVINFGTGVITTSKNLPTTNLPYCALRIKSVGTPNVYEVVVARGAAAYRYAYATIQYFV